MAYVALLIQQALVLLHPLQLRLLSLHFHSDFPLCLQFQRGVQHLLTTLLNILPPLSRKERRFFTGTYQTVVNETATGPILPWLLTESVCVWLSFSNAHSLGETRHRPPSQFSRRLFQTKTISITKSSWLHVTLKSKGMFYTQANINLHCLCSFVSVLTDAIYQPASPHSVAQDINKIHRRSLSNEAEM